MNNEEETFGGLSRLAPEDPTSNRRDITYRQDVLSSYGKESIIVRTSIIEGRENALELVTLKKAQRAAFLENPTPACVLGKIGYSD